MLARLKIDKIEEKKRLAPYYIGGFSRGANSSMTEGVHSKELAPYLESSQKNGSSNGVSKESTNDEFLEKAADDVVNEELTRTVSNGYTPDELTALSNGLTSPGIDKSISLVA